MIPVNKVFLPPIEEYTNILSKAWEYGQITNQGKLLLQLENDLKKYLNIDNIQFVSNGTISLQLAIRALDLSGSDSEIITTPFSYVATVSSILWEGCKPVFVDIESNNFCIDASKIEEKITSKTKAIMAVHVFGYVCDIEKIKSIADKYNLKVIYDAAHAFGVEYKGKSIFNYGDISSCSFHATKLFHTVEGGACFTNNKNLDDKINLIKKFGHVNDDHYCLGINAKNSEFHAAMGLINLKHISEIISERKKISTTYDLLLNKAIIRPKNQENTSYNYSYYPIVFESENDLKKNLLDLNKNNIFPRRYFYPSLNKLSYLKDYFECQNSESIASRIMCLPLYCGLKEGDLERISKIINNNI